MTFMRFVIFLIVSRYACWVLISCISLKNKRCIMAIKIYEGGLGVFCHSDRFIYLFFGINSFMACIFVLVTVEDDFRGSKTHQSVCLDVSAP